MEEGLKKLQFVFYFTKKYMFYFMFERERERQRVNREGQRVGEAENLKQAPGSELSAESPTCGSNSCIVRS